MNGERMTKEWQDDDPKKQVLIGRFHFYLPRFTKRSAIWWSWKRPSLQRKKESSCKLWQRTREPSENLPLTETDFKTSCIHRCQHPSSSLIRLLSHAWSHCCIVCSEKEEKCYWAHWSKPVCCKPPSHLSIAVQCIASTYRHQVWCTISAMHASSLIVRIA